MPRSRPVSNPVSFHRQTNQYYVTRFGKRIYLGSDREQALKRYHEIGLGRREKDSHVNANEPRRYTERLSIGEQLAQCRRLIVTGDPGAGKTTLVRWLATA
jgi:predicted NACHT family NTPase